MVVWDIRIFFTFNVETYIVIFLAITKINDKSEVFITPVICINSVGYIGYTCT